MIAASSFRQYSRIVRHFASARAPEVLALQASPLLGCALGGFSLAPYGTLRLGILLFGSLALTAHIFIFNDWVGYSSDLHDPRRAEFVFTRQGISRGQVAVVTLALLGVANVAFVAIGTLATLLGAAIAILSVLYSCSALFGKRAPVVGSLNHMLGGALHFLLGYGAFHVLDTRGIAISLFFGLVFAGGHLNHEVRDYEGDLLNGIRTSAVVFGRERAFLASVATFTAAYATVVALAALGMLPSFLLLSALGWLAHMAWSVRALRRGLGFESAAWMQRRYRLLFALIGVAMLCAGAL